MSLDLDYARRLALGSHDHGLKWIEDALPPDDYWGYAALRQAQGDVDAVVQKRAAEAIGLICVANNLPVETAPAASGAAVAAQPKPGFGTKPRAVAPRPDLYVVIKSSSDDSPGRHDKKARKVHADALREAMTTELASAQLVTLTATDAKKFGLDPRQLDLSIVGLELRQGGAEVVYLQSLHLSVALGGAAQPR